MVLDTAGQRGNLGSGDAVMQATQRIAFILIGGGILAALGFFLKWFFGTSVVSLGFRIAIGAVIVGVILLLAAAGWERYRATKGKEDEFKEVKY